MSKSKPARKARSTTERIEFTQARVAALPAPAQGQVTVHDTGQPGLSVRISSGGAKTFEVFGRVREKKTDGTHDRSRPVRVRLGRYPKMNVETARQQAREKLNEMEAGTNPNVKKQAEAKRGESLRELFGRYRAARAAKLRERTLDDYESTITLHFADWMARPYVDITPGMVEPRFDRISKGSGPAAANMAMRVLRALLNYAEVAPNPVKRLSTARRWHHDARRDTIIADADMPAWWAAVEGLADGGAGDMHRDYLLTLLLTGLRKSEAAGLRVQDVDLDARTLLIPDPKNRQPHTMPLGRYLHAIIRRRVEAAQAAKAAWVFPSEQGGHLVDPRKAMAKVTKDSGVRFMPHDLRRTFATVAEAQDTGWLTLKNLLNHKVRDQNVTAGYITTNVERLRKPMQAIEDALLKRAKVKPPAEVVALRGRAGGT